MEFPSQEADAGGISNLQAQLQLPKGPGHFISDIRDEYEAFCKVVRHASGAIKRKIDEMTELHGACQKGIIKGNNYA